MLSFLSVSTVTLMHCMIMYLWIKEVCYFLTCRLPSKALAAMQGEHTHTHHHRAALLLHDTTLLRPAVWTKQPAAPRKRCADDPAVGHSADRQSESDREGDGRRGGLDVPVRGLSGRFSSRDDKWGSEWEEENSNEWAFHSAFGQLEE